MVCSLLKTSSGKYLIHIQDKKQIDYNTVGVIGRFSGQEDEIYRLPSESSGILYNFRNFL